MMDVAPRKRRLVAYVCPGCERVVEAVVHAEVVHECPSRGNRVTVFKRRPTPDDASSR